jgi:protein TonB
MESKKSDKVRLENYSRLFFQLGLALALFVVYISVEHRSYERTLSELAYNLANEEDIEDIPITERIEQIKPPPPPPAAAPEKIEIVEDQSELEEAVLESTETDENQLVEVSDIEEIEEVVEEEVIEADVPFAVIEEAPIYPGCKGNKVQRKKCLQEKVREHVNRKFNTELAGELGLEAGNKKVYVQFRIDKTGAVTDIRARGPHIRLEKEAIRVVRSLPKMTPGRQRGRAVSVRYTLPITLRVV